MTIDTRRAGHRGSSSNVVEPSGRRRDGDDAGALRQKCTRTGARTTGHVRGGREGGQGQADPVPASGRDDTAAIAAGAGPERAAVRDFLPRGAAESWSRAGIRPRPTSSRPRFHAMPRSARSPGCCRMKRQAARHPLPELESHDAWQRQLRDLPGQDAQISASAALRATRARHQVKVEPIRAIGGHLHGIRVGRLP